jgi:voltage-gated potassium channel Kch
VVIILLSNVFALFSAIFFISDPLHTFTVVADVASIFPAAKIGGLLSTPGNGRSDNYCMPSTTYVAGVSRII